MSDYTRHKLGFSLIQLSVLLTVASLVLVVTLPSYQTKLTSNQNSTNKLNSVLSAVRDFQLANGRLPCPADASITVGNTNYGVEAANQNANCTGSTPAANVQSNNVAIGMIPVKTLGLSNDVALDGYGRYITYGVDTTATGCWASQSLSGQIIIDDPDYSPGSGKAFTKNALVALVSHGADGYGAFLPAVSSGTLNRFNAGSSDTDEALNAHVTPGTVTSTGSTQGTDSNSVTATFVSKKPTSGFDDLVVYGSNMWNMNSMPSSLTTVTMVTSQPTNGTYNSTSPPLTFTLTTPQPVTVSAGTLPRIAITAITNSTYATAKVGSTMVNGVSTGYALYTGVTNTPTTSLPFSYTILASDYAPAGIAISSPLNMNGGGAFVNPCFTFFSPLSLSGVMITLSDLYVVDVGHNRVVKMDLQGNYIATYGAGASGTSDYKFSAPLATVVDNSGNVYLTDSNTVDRVLEFSSNGTWAMTIGGEIGATEQCSGTYVNATTCSALPQGGYSKCCAPNAASCTCHAGNAPTSPLSTTNGQLNLSAFGGQMALDSSGNLWVVDAGNSRVVEFYTLASGGSTYQGGYISQVSTPSAAATGVAFDPNNNYLWTMTPGSGGGCALQRCTYSGSWSCTTKSLGCGSTNGKFYDNAGDSGYIAVDTSGNVFVVDESNCRVQEFDKTGAFVKVIADPGTCTLGGSNGPQGVAVDSNDHVWIASGPDSTVYKVQISTGTTLQTLTTANSIPFNSPQGIYIGR